MDAVSDSPYWPPFTEDEKTALLRDNEVCDSLHALARDAQGEAHAGYFGFVRAQHDNSPEDDTD